MPVTNRKPVKTKTRDDLRKKFDWSKLEGMMLANCTLNSCAFHLDCSEQLVKRRVLEKTGLSFEQYRDLHKDSVRRLLIQKTIDKALEGNVPLMIFALKNLCNWSDKNQEVSVHTNISLADMFASSIKKAEKKSAALPEDLEIKK